MGSAIANLFFITQTIYKKNKWKENPQHDMISTEKKPPTLN